jgi:uncharacterized Fe-S cluster protein YjdI/CDGSH-type Zn-finger protein
MKRYTGRGVDITFDPARCLHAAECLRDLPAVFDTARRPWILPDGAPADQVAEVIQRCPTGALHYALADGPDERGDRPTTLSAEPHAPTWVRGELRLTPPDGSDLQEARAALCHCGQTANRPFCDASGECTGWHERRAQTRPVRDSTAAPEQRD